MNIENAYKILNLDKSASQEDIFNSRVALTNMLLDSFDKKEIVEEEYQQKAAELKEAYSTAIHSLNNKDNKKELESYIKPEKEKVSASSITAKRGRLIRKIKSQIKNLKKSKKTPEDEENLKKLENLLEEEIENHKEQLTDRYHKEFLDKKATFSDIFTALPRGLGIQIKKIGNCIDELKIAKNNKERIAGVFDLVKEAGILAATPFTFLGKFVIKHWYIPVAILAALYELGQHSIIRRY